MEAKNPKYANAEKTCIDLDINHPTLGWIPFTSSPNDSEPHGRELFERATLGEFGEVGTYVPMESE